MRALWMGLMVLLLGACGGGGGDSPVTEPPPVQPPVQPPAAVDMRGVYSVANHFAGTVSGYTTAKLYVHSDGAVRLSMQSRRADADTAREEVVTASGTMTSGTGESRSAQVSLTYASTLDRRGTDGAFRTAESSSGTITATLRLTAAQLNGEAALTVDMGDVPLSVRTVTVAKEPAPASLEQLNGFYIVRFWRPGAMVMETLVQVNAVTGTLSGQFGPNCAIGGRLYDIELPTKTFRQEWTFTGTGCPLTGTGQFTGNVLYEHTITLSSEGLDAWSGTRVDASLPTATLPGTFGEIAGRWGPLAIHPDGTVHTGNFAGRLQRSGERYVAVGDYVHTSTNAEGAVESRVQGTATLTLTPTTVGPKRALAATVTSDTVPVSDPSFTGEWEARNPYFVGLPMQGLVGLYRTGWVSTPGGPPMMAVFGDSADARIDSTGAISGTVSACTISGRLYDYDPWSGVFKQDVTLGGASCPVTGSGRMLGTPGIADRGGMFLSSQGLVGGWPTGLLLGSHTP